MPVVHQHNAVLLGRILSLKDYTPFLLVRDSVAQSGELLVREILHRVPKGTNTVFLSFETVNPPETAHVIECQGLGAAQIAQMVAEKVKGSRTVVFVDTLAYVPTDKLTAFLMALVRQNVTLVATMHTSLPSAIRSRNSRPAPVTLASYLATTCITVRPIKGDIHEEEKREYKLDRLELPVGSCNQRLYECELVHRRRSGRSMVAVYTVNSVTHEITYVAKEQQEDVEEDPSLLQGLATFNLTTTDKQKQARENVDLPFLSAQEFGDGGAQGGAIVYQFEKDDDYDEEDPYEDPF
ncbi:elongator complex protein 5 [Trichomonascus vanleenenianus]|uniref:Elongator subunit IKI1 n=1 Tax=Trichomonascus vanleenenianus TaxID=2268995 RepID=UPI003ECB5A73